MTIIIGHATFCIVVVYNNAIARLRRTARSTEEASMDLGADTCQTFRHVTLPAIGTALVAGALLAFALSFDEIIVTTSRPERARRRCRSGSSSNYQRPGQVPLVNVASVIVLALSMIPVYLAQRISSSVGGVAAVARPHPRPGWADALHRVVPTGSASRGPSAVRRPGLPLETAFDGDRGDPDDGEDTGNELAHAAPPPAAHPPGSRRPTPPRSARSKTTTASVAAARLAATYPRIVAAGSRSARHIDGSWSGDRNRLGSSLKSSRQPRLQNQ